MSRLWAIPLNVRTRPFTYADPHIFYICCQTIRQFISTVKTNFSSRLRSEDGDRFIAEPYPLPDRPEVRSTEASHDDYLRNLGIIREADQKRLRDHYSGARDMRNGIRYKTFIPDYCSEVRAALVKLWI